MILDINSVSCFDKELNNTTKDDGDIIADVYPFCALRHVSQTCVICSSTLSVFSSIHHLPLKTYRVFTSICIFFGSFL